MIKSEFDIYYYHTSITYTQKQAVTVYLVLNYHQKIEFKLLNLSLRIQCERTYITIMLQQP